MAGGAGVAGAQIVADRDAAALRVVHLQRVGAQRLVRAGADVELTLDMDLQAFAEERMKDQSASAVMIDVRNGEILAFISNPGYDPNEFIAGFTQKRWEEMNADPLKPLLNKALAGEYAPGSTFKLVTALAGLEAGAIDATSRISCRGSLRLGSHTFHCHRRGGHGAVVLIKS